jgi:hypothetical protein
MLESYCIACRSELRIRRDVCDHTVLWLVIILAVISKTGVQALGTLGLSPYEIAALRLAPDCIVELLRNKIPGWIPY